ncbi:MAG: coiled-coil domain-containing protein [Clostridia bacterium]
MGISEILKLVLCFLIMIIMGLALAYLYMSYKSKNQVTGNHEDKKTKTKSDYTKLSIYDFMQFDKIEDNMIVQNNGARYLMVIECEGINYDLMSEVEKTAVEAGFVQFLNTLRYQIQIYVQTKTINISSSVQNYKKRLDEIKKDLEQKENDYEKLKEEKIASEKEKKELMLEVNRLRNLYEYGVDVVTNIEKVSQNKNVLRKSYYIIVPYYSSEVTNDMLSEEEKHNIIFSELYTRAQSLIRSLYACNVKGRILNSTDIAELLYVAYNRDESEVYGLDKALKAGYDELYVTAPDVLEKRMASLDNEIEKRAFKLAKETMEEVQNEKELKIQEKEKSFDDLVREMAEMILEENKASIGDELAEESIKKIENSKNQTKEEGGKKNEKTKKANKK